MKYVSDAARCERKVTLSETEDKQKYFYILFSDSNNEIKQFFKKDLIVYDTIK